MVFDPCLHEILGRLCKKPGALRFTKSIDVHWDFYLPGFLKSVYVVKNGQDTSYGSSYENKARKEDG